MRKQLLIAKHIEACKTLPIWEPFRRRLVVFVRRLIRKEGIKMKISTLDIVLFTGLFVIGVLTGSIFTRLHTESVYRQVLQERTEEKFRAEKDLNACLAVLEDDEIGTYILSDKEGITK